MSELLNIERTGFAARLKQALKTAGYTSSPSLVAREFNVRHVALMIAPTTASGWLCARAVPGEDRLRALATWLNVTPEWLRFGSGTPEVGVEAMAFAVDYQGLDAYGQRVAREFMRGLVRLSLGG